MKFQGSETVTAVAFAPSALASPNPCVTALAANSDPSVAIRMCLYTCARFELGSRLDWVLSASPATMVLLCGGVRFTLTCVKARDADRKTMCEPVRKFARVFGLIGVQF